MRGVLLNLSGLDPAVNGGVSRIAREVSRLHADAERGGDVRVAYAVNPAFAEAFGDWIGYPQASVVPILAGGPMPLLEALRPDLIVSPLFGAAPFDRPDCLGGVPHVMLMPDAFAFDMPELFEAEDLERRRRLYEALGWAALVVTLSRHARERLLHHLGLDPSRVAVVPAGVDLPEEASAVTDVAGPYVLSCANDWPNKRHDLLFAAMSQAWRRRPELRLVLTGSHAPGFIEAMRSRHDCLPEQAIDLGFVSDDRLRALYGDAEALVHPSCYEGFGIPIAEAMAAGCPVICAPLAAIPEVAGDAALYVDSDEPSAWARALTDELPRLRDGLIERGRRQAARYSSESVREGWRRELAPFWSSSSEGAEAWPELDLQTLTTELSRWARWGTGYEQAAHERMAVIEELKHVADERAAIIRDLHSPVTLGARATEAPGLRQVRGGATCVWHAGVRAIRRCSVWCTTCRRR